MKKKVTFPVLYHFWSSYKVGFGHLYLVILTFLMLTLVSHKFQVMGEVSFFSHGELVTYFLLKN